MNSFLEAYLVSHTLIAVSSLFIGGRHLLSSPSLKLKLVRIALVSCLVAPAIAPLIQGDHPHLSPAFMALDSSGEARDQTLENKSSLQDAIPRLQQSTRLAFQHWHLLFALLLLGCFYRVYKLLRDLKKIRLIIKSSVIYKSYGRLSIQVSDHCLIPFSTSSLTRSYIVLPVSLLSSATDMKMAIAHEGQHHRQGDCLWAYAIESLHMLFWANPGFARYRRILTELQELSCDETVVGHRLISAHDYGHCLFALAQMVSEHAKTDHREIACTVGMVWHNGKNREQFITRRICMLSKYNRHASRAICSLSLTLLTISLPLYAAYTAKGTLSPSSGKSLDLSSVNPKVQRIADEEITSAVRKYKAQSGAVAIADPKTGEWLAFAEAGSRDPSQSWRSRVFPAASTIKPFIAAAGIDAGVSSDSQIYDCRGPYRIGDQTFHNYDPNFSDHTLREALSQSINVCIIKLAQDIGATKLLRKLTQFGFDTDWREETSDVQLARTALGTHVPVTFQSLMKSYMILANKGRGPSQSPSVISESNADSVTSMLVDAVSHGTAMKASIPGIDVAGKTGTMVTEPSEANESSRLALFVGYVPANAPRFLALIVIEDGHEAKGKGEGTGGSLAAPLFQKIYTKSSKFLAKE
ncbi:MAG: hypothetical protein KA436_01925 [Oligoflexales bacterium]|nr:hypothetical protein [Oligoflexales bacterium]